MSKWENGTAYPDITLLPAIARYFGVSIDRLFGRSSRGGPEGRAVLDEWRQNNSEAGSRITSSCCGPPWRSIPRSGGL